MRNIVADLEWEDLPVGDAIKTTATGIGHGGLGTLDRDRLHGGHQWEQREVQGGAKGLVRTHFTTYSPYLLATPFGIWKSVTAMSLSDHSYYKKGRKVRIVSLSPMSL